jgi:hypothetical protein
MRWLRRRQLLREAEALEVQARRLRLSVADKLALTGEPVALAAGIVGILGLGYAAEAAPPQHRGAARVAYREFTRGRDDAKADALEARAKALREEARRC